MSRACYNVASRRRKKRLLKKVRGYWGARSRLYRHAQETYNRALRYAFRDRKAKKRDFRRLWIIRINAAIRSHGISYSRFINALHQAKVAINRKLLAAMIIDDSKGFERLIELARKYLPATASACDKEKKE